MTAPTNTPTVEQIVAGLEALINYNDRDVFLTARVRPAIAFLRSLQQRERREGSGEQHCSCSMGNASARLHADWCAKAAQVATPPAKACEEVDQGRKAPASDMSKIAKRINAEARAKLSLDEQGRKDADLKTLYCIHCDASLGKWDRWKSHELVCEFCGKKSEFAAIASAGEGKP